MTIARYRYVATRADQIMAGNLICLPRGPIREVATADHWTRWDGAAMVTLIDTNGRGLAAREAGWMYQVEHQLEAVQ